MSGNRAARLWTVVLVLSLGAGELSEEKLHAAEALSFLKVESGFEPSGIRASLDGRFATVWGQSPKVEFGKGRKETSCIIVELDGGRVVGRHTLPMRTSLVEIDDRYLYYVPEHESVILRSPHASLDKVTRIPLDAPPKRIWIHPDGSLIVWTSVFGAGNTRVFDRDTAQRKENHPLWNLAFPVSGPWESAVSILPDGMFQEEGAILDARTFEVQCAAEVPLLINVHRSNQAIPFLALKEWQIGWGRGVDGRQLLDARGTELARLPAGARGPLRSFPLIPVIQSDDGPGGPLLQLRDAKAGEVVASVTLGNDRVSSFGVLHADAGQRLLVASRVGLFIVPIPETLKATLPVPLHLKYPKVPVVTLDGMTTFDARAAGGDGQRRFALQNEADGLSIDSKSGRVTIDGRKLWEQYQKSQRPKNRSGNASESTISWGARDYRHFTREALPPDHIAAALTVWIAVSDEKNGFDAQVVYPIMMIPRSAVARTRGAPNSPAPKNVPSEEPSESKPGRPPDREERLRKLEQGMSGAEATLEAIERRVDLLERNRPKPQGR